MASGPVYVAVIAHRRMRVDVRYGNCSETGCSCRGLGTVVHAVSSLDGDTLPKEPGFRSNTAVLDSHSRRREFAWKSFLDPESRHRGARFHRSLRHRIARMERRRIEISRLHLQHGLSFMCLFQRGQPCVPQIICRMGHRALVCATDRVLAKRITKNTPVIAVYGTGPGN